MTGTSMVQGKTVHAVSSVSTRDSAGKTGQDSFQDLLSMKASVSDREPVRTDDNRKQDQACRPSNDSQDQRPAGKTESAKDEGLAEDRVEDQDGRKKDTLKPGEVVFLMGAVPTAAVDETAADAAMTDGQMAEAAVDRLTSQNVVEELTGAAVKGEHAGTELRQAALPAEEALISSGHTSRTPQPETRGDVGNTENVLPDKPVVPFMAKEAPADGREPVLTKEAVQQNTKADGLKITGNAEGTGHGGEKASMSAAEGRMVTAEEKPADKRSESPEGLTQKQAALDAEGGRQQPETVRIKVAEPFRQVGQPMQREIGAQITDHIQAGNREFYIQLEPENLGRISIKIALLETGVKVLLSCDNAKTMGLLSDRAGNIGQIVEQNTGSHTVVEVQEDNYWSQQKDATDEHQRQNGGREEQRNPEREESEDFIQQLRLGLFDREAVM